MKNAEPNCAAPSGLPQGRTPSRISLVHSNACMPTKVAPRPPWRASAPRSCRGRAGSRSSPPCAIVPLLVIRTKVMIAISSSGTSARRSRARRPRSGSATARWSTSRTVMYEIRKHAEDERVAEQEDPHHRLAPRHALEGALVRRPVGDDALPAPGAAGVLPRRRCSSRLRRLTSTSITAVRDVQIASSRSVRQQQRKQHRARRATGNASSVAHSSTLSRIARRSRSARAAGRWSCDPGHQAAEHVQAVHGGQQVEEGRWRDCSPRSTPASRAAASESWPARKRRSARRRRAAASRTPSRSPRCGRHARHCIATLPRHSSAVFSQQQPRLGERRPVRADAQCACACRR